MFQIRGVFRNFFKEGPPGFDIFFCIFLAELVWRKLMNISGSRGGPGDYSHEKLLKIYILQWPFSAFSTIFREILYIFFAPDFDVLHQIIRIS